MAALDRQTKKRRKKKEIFSLFLQRFFPTTITTLSFFFLLIQSLSFLLKTNLANIFRLFFYCFKARKGGFLFFLMHTKHHLYFSGKTKLSILATQVLFHSFLFFSSPSLRLSIDTHFSQKRLFIILLLVYIPI
jgi:hypothetical protein